MTFKMSRTLTAVLPFFATILAQQIGTKVPEVHPKLPTQFCTTSGGCVVKQTTLVTDALSHPLHAVDNPSVSCATTPINSTLCPDAATCAKNCVLEGIDYGSIGVLTSGSALTMRQYLFDGSAYKSVSPRLYLMADDDKNYEPLKLNNQELTFDVDVSRLGCGMNGALYLSEMDMSGSRSDLNPAGAQYGTGYCDAQCFSTPFVNGQPNLNNSGVCCNEMDIWEANSVATALTPHTCSSPGSFLCTGAQCNRTVGVCDKNGCGINPFASGNKNFYGPGVGMTVDTSRPFTVVTQFFTSDNTSTGTLQQIKRIYIQDGKLIQNEALKTLDVMSSDSPMYTPSASYYAPRSPDSSSDSSSAASDLLATMDGTITQDFCTAKNASDFNRLGGMKTMGESLNRGMVLIFSIWNSDGDFMNWLDSGTAGPCNATAGDPKGIIKDSPDVSVTFSNIKWGDIGSTFNMSGIAASILDESKAVAVSASMGSSVSPISGWAILLGFVVTFLLK
jgi:cellulase